jgi:hypothetical protein
MQTLFIVLIMVALLAGLCPQPSLAFQAMDPAKAKLIRSAQGMLGSMIPWDIRKQ